VRFHDRNIPGIERAVRIYVRTEIRSINSLTKSALRLRDVSGVNCTVSVCVADKAASIVFVAAQNVFWPQRSRGASRLGVAFFFGLFHGLGFAGGLLDAMEGMAGLTIGLAIVAFSVGIEIGHQVAVVPIFALLKLLRSRHGAASHFAHGIFRYGSAAICLTGLFYLIAALRS
jgi:hypothetical protein